MAGLLWRARAADKLGLHIHIVAASITHGYRPPSASSCCTSSTYYGQSYLLWQASFGVLVLLIIYAKRRESARFLRIQNNLQGILGKQALLTTHYGYTHYGYTYCGSMGNKQAPYSPLQPSYHPL